MSRPPCLRDRWRTEVWRSHGITDSTRTVLLFLAERMAANGYVSVPRSELAEALNRSPRRITERIELAHRAGFLDTVRHGGPGRTAEYRACLPVPSMVRTGAPSDSPEARSTYGAATSTHSGADGGTNRHGADGGPANTRARSTQGERSEHVALHDPAGSQDDSDGEDTPCRFVDRYAQLHSTRQAGRRLVRVVGEPPDHGSAETHDLTARLRDAGVSRRVAAFAWKRAAA